MTTYVALLRAVNVGGTGALPMTTLKALCEEASFTIVRTHIASGNVVFDSRLGEAKVKAAIEKNLAAFAGKKVDVLVRTAAEMTAVVAANPFADRRPNLTLAIFIDEPPPADAIDAAVGRDAEQIALGTREIYGFHAGGIADSKLRIPAATTGTGRNRNTVAKLAQTASR